MRILIVESDADLAQIWARHLERQGFDVDISGGSEKAIAMISARPYDGIVIDLVLDEGSALAVSDYVQYRQPVTNIIFVTNTTFFSDGSIFTLGPSARALMRSSAPPEDIAATVAHYAEPSRRRAMPDKVDVFSR